MSVESANKIFLFSSSFYNKGVEVELFDCVLNAIASGSPVEVQEQTNRLYNIIVKVIILDICFYFVIEYN